MSEFQLESSSRFIYLVSHQTEPLQWILSFNKELILPKLEDSETGVSDKANLYFYSLPAKFYASYRITGFRKRQYRNVIWELANEKKNIVAYIPVF